MQIKSILILSLIISSSSLSGQDLEKYKNLDWRIYHWLSFSDYIDIQSEEWKNIPRKEKNALMQIPANELITMSTKALIEAYTDCRFARSFFLFNEVNRYYEQLYRGFNGVRELMSREDAAEEIIKYYTDMDPQDNTISPAGIAMPFQVQFIEYLIGNPSMLEKYSYDQLRRIAAELIGRYHIIQAVGLENNLQSNIYAIVQVLGCTGTEEQEELMKIEDISIIQETGRITNDTIIPEIIDLAVNYVGE